MLWALAYKLPENLFFFKSLGHLFVVNSTKSAKYIECLSITVGIILQILSHKIKLRYFVSFNMTDMCLTRPFKRSACEHLEYLKNTFWQEVNHCVYYLCHIKLLYQKVIKSSAVVRPIRCQQCSNFNRIHVNLTKAEYYCLSCILKFVNVTAVLYISIDHCEVYCKTCINYVYDDEIYYLIRYYTTLLLKNELPFKKDELGRFVVERSYLDNEQILISKYSQPTKCTGLRGILNLGNTCYLNVIVQALIYNPIIQDFFLKGKHEFHTLEDSLPDSEVRHLSDFCFACDLDELIKDTFNPSLLKPTSPTNLLYHSWIAFKELAGHSQQDSHEYFMHLLNSLHDALSANCDPKVNCTCVIHHAFGAKLESNVRCTSCDVKSQKFDPVLDINLDIKINSTKGTLINCLDRFFGEEVLHHFTCTKCFKKQDAKRKMTFSVLPNILAIQLKRFEVAKSVSKNSSNVRQKIDTLIFFPMELNMSKYSTDNNMWYELFAVIQHRGKLDSGHYTMYSKYNERWFLFDDHKVDQVSPEEVLNTKAYLLFYCRKVPI
eukprot:NODE_387_length_9532_cov_0.176402.p1 type:complete len:547 gc:universal NODE_387_length_9532_cov_0.176402:7895-6255(-)